MDYDNNELIYRIVINTTNSKRNNVIIKDILNSAGVNYEQSSIKIATGTWLRTPITIGHCLTIKK